MSEERFDRIDQELTELKAGQAQLSKEVGQMNDALSHVQDTLSREMRILYEQTVDNIKALSVDVPELERRWKADDAEVREDIGRHLDPLEAIVKKHFGV